VFQFRPQDCTPTYQLNEALRSLQPALEIAGSRPLIEDTKVKRKFSAGRLAMLAVGIARIVALSFFGCH
jgi:hypothetical protein